MEENQDNQDVSQLTQEVQQYKTYPKKWYILTLFCLLASSQYLVWNVFGPIESSMKYAFEWNDTVLAEQPLWGTIILVLLVFQLGALQEKYGLYFSVSTASLLMALGASARFMFIENYPFTVTAHIGSFFNGITGIAVMSLPPALSAAWFPPEQRTLATCIAQVSTQVGTGLSFTLGPLIVPGKTQSDISAEAKNQTDVDEVKDQVHKYLVGQGAFAIVLFFLIILTFQDKPASPPSASASLPRTDFWTAFHALRKDRNAVLCTLAYGASGGTFLAWQSVMSVNFQNIGVSDATSGKIGLTICICCAVGSVIVAYATDHLKKHMKLTLITLLLIEAIFFTWMTLILAKAIPFYLWQLYVSSVVGSVCTFSLVPLFFEYTVELTYPTPEGLVGGFLACFYNFVGTIFLCMFFFHNIGYLWINVLLICGAVCK